MISVRKRKICVVTGTRAEYGLLYWLIKEIQEDSDLKLQLVATGMHLSPEFGLTYRDIERDGLTIDEKVEMLLSSDTPTGIAKSIGLGVIGFADAFERLKPDLLVLLGDRYEILAAAQAALVANIPVAHIHGGELTEGAIDESIRHCITKMSQIHFVAAEPYRKRVIQLGESPDKVFNFGAPGVEAILRLKKMDLSDLEKELNFKLGDKFFLVTYHPVTTELKEIESAMKQLLNALDEFPDYRILFTRPNSDTGGRIIGKRIDEYVEKNPKRVFVSASLGQLRYLNAMRLCSAVIGNSSSGIIEAPVFSTPTVNIGNRQQGRLRAVSVIDCKEDKDEIVKSIEKALSQDFLDKLISMKRLRKNIDSTSASIKNVIKNMNLSGICQKHFHDLNQEESL